MRLKILFLNQYMIFHNLFEYIIAKPIIGERVRQARVGEFPSVVSLMHINNNIEALEEEHFCTGALFTNSHVLTAAHCLEETLKNETQVIIGSIDLRCGLAYFPLWWATYNQWAGVRRVRLEFRSNDIAIIKLTRNVPSEIPPMAISNEVNNRIYGLTVLAAGWGISNSGVTPRIMETVALTVLSNTDCEQRIATSQGFKVPVHERHLCSIGVPYAVMQVGDSGCPIIFAGVILGVQKSTVPFPELAFHPRKVNIHTGVQYYRPFILDVLNSNQRWF